MRRTLCVLLMLVFLRANIVNDDNYVLFSHDVKGTTSIPTKDGKLILVSHKIAIVNLETWMPEIVKLITYADGSPLYLERGILTPDGKRLVVSPGGLSGGPNCTFHLVFELETLSLLATNCIGQKGDNLFWSLENDFEFYPNGNNEILIGGAYENYIGGLKTLYLMKAKL